MNVAQVRKFAMSLPAVTEAPHHAMSSFRVEGKIFATLPPDGDHLHVFVDETEREQALVLTPAAVEKLFWGSKVAGLRIVLSEARPAAVQRLLRLAWARKASRKLVAASGIVDP